MKHCVPQSPCSVECLGEQVDVHVLQTWVAPQEAQGVVEDTHVHVNAAQGAPCGLLPCL